MKNIRVHFLTGLLIVVPFSVVAWLVVTIIRTIGKATELFHTPEVPGTPAGIFLSIVVVAVFFFTVSGIGMISKLYFGQKALEALTKLVEKIPFLGTVFQALDQLIKTFSGATNKQFNRVVYVEYPRKEVWTIGFVTGEPTGPNAPKDHINVFVPTVPNPTSGFYLIVQKDDVKDAGLSVEEAFRTILSLGISHPSKTPPSSSPN